VTDTALMNEQMARKPGFDPSVFPGARKVALVITALGTESGARVLAHFSPPEVEAIIREVKDLAGVSVDEASVLLGQLRDEAVARKHLVAGGIDRAREILTRSHGSDAENILEQIMAAAANEPFQFLRARRPEVVLSYLAAEHPQVIAVVLAHLPMTLSARVLEGLDPVTRAEVAERFATLEMIEPAVVKEMEAALERRVGVGPAVESSSTRGGVKPLAALLNNVARETEKGVLSDLERVDPQLAADIRDLMFVFEDLVQLDDRALQEILREAGARTVALALKDCPIAVKDRLEKNLSQRAAEDIAELADSLGPVRRSEVEAAQQELVRAARKLEQEGKIVLMRADSGEFVV
jgi:flagellar motor switch protein FliG